MQNDEPPAPPEPEPTGLEFIETPVFTDGWKRVGLDDEDLRGLQTRLLLQPDAGDIIPKSGCLRKLRVAAKGKGSRGGARVIYYWLRSDSQVLLLLVYPKNEKDDLTAKELKILKQLAGLL